MKIAKKISGGLYFKTSLKGIGVSFCFLFVSVSSFAQSYETQFAKPLGQVLQEISTRFNVKLKYEADTTGRILPFAINPDGSEMSIAEAKAKAAKNELKEADFKYTVHQIPFTGVKISSVPEKYYFFPIKQSVIDLNSNIEQNSNWGGTFNPTLE
jgi:hypothetical protein